MKKWAYTGTDERHFLYPAAFTVSPGAVIEADENPDEQYFEPATKAAIAAAADQNKEE